MVPVDYMNINQATVLQGLPEQNNVAVLPNVIVPKEIGDLHLRIVGLLRKKAQDYAQQQGGFYVFVYNMIAQNYFQNQLFYRFVQIAVDGAAYTPYSGGMLVESTITQAVSVAYTGLVGQLIEQYGNQPEVSNMARTLMTPAFKQMVNNYNQYIENNVNQFIRLRSQRNQQASQPMYGQPQQQPVYQQQPQQQMYQQPQQVYQQPIQNAGWNQEQVRAQAVQNGQMPYYPPNQPIQQQPQQYQAYQQPITTQVTGMASSGMQQSQPVYQQPVQVQQPQQQENKVLQPWELAMMPPAQPKRGEPEPWSQQIDEDLVASVDAYINTTLNPKPQPKTDDAWSNIQEFGSDGVVYGDDRGHQDFALSTQDLIEINAAAGITNYQPPEEHFKEAPVPKRVGDVKLEPGVHGKVFDTRRPFDHFISNGGVHVYSELYAYNHKIVSSLTELHDFANEVAFVVKWPDGRLENMTVPISEEMSYMANETLELALPYAHAQRGVVADMLKDLYAGKKPSRKEYRDLTDEEITNHEPLEETIEVAGTTDGERDVAARTAVRDRDGAIAGVVTYHSYERTPLSAVTEEAKGYLSETLNAATDLTDLAFGITSLYDAGDITEESVRILDQKMTKALNGYFQTEKGTTLYLDSFLDDIAGMMGWMEAEHTAIYDELMEEQAELIKRVFTSHIDYADTKVGNDEDEDVQVTDDADQEDFLYIEDHQVNILLPLHSLNFAMLLKQKRFAMALNRKLHGKLEGYISYHIVDHNNYTRIRVVTSDGVELYAVKGQKGVICLTADPKHI